jgi:hypothetical protein
MRKLLITGLVTSCLLFPSVQYGQKADFTGMRIFLNPGHGGNDSDDRHMLATDFWESEGNLEKGLFLRDLLKDRNATVFISRTTNYTSDDLPLSSIAAMANTANADIFVSIHSNGFDGTRNQPLVLFRGYDDQPVYPQSKVMAQILWAKLFEKGNCWTNTFEWVKGDWTFYPEWGDKVGLGVLRTLTMPGVLSEGSYHDYIPESWRLRNKSHLHHESWAILRALAEYGGVNPEPIGIIAGTVRDNLTSPSYYFKPGTKDEDSPVNNAVVTLMPDNIAVTLDNLNNGFFMFDSLAPGNYQVICSGIPDYLTQTLDVAVTAGKTTLADFLPAFDTTRFPVVLDFITSTADSLPFNQEFTLVFNIPMNRNVVQTNLVFSPAVSVVYEWDEKGKVLTVKPEVGFTSMTNYQLRLITGACSQWNVPLLSEFQYNFVTRSRTKFKVERIYPSVGLSGVTLYPRVTVFLDAPPDQASASAGIRLVNSQSEQLARIREKFATVNGKGIYSFEPEQPLTVNSQYRIILDAGVKDITGVTLGENSGHSFTTRAKAYETGTVVEPFDDISGFWDPEASGSTVGTDNPLTTFTPSYDILRTGSVAGRLDYVFTGETGGICRVFDTRKPVIGSNLSSSFAMWVYGDLSNNVLEYWFYSPGSVNQIVFADTVDWAGWDLVSVPFSRIGGSGDWQYHSLVINQTPGGAKQGSMIFDDAMVITPTSISEAREDEIDFIVYPNPSSSSATVTYSLSAAAEVSIDLFTPDGRRAENIFHGKENPGTCLHQWTPPGDLPAGNYIIRLEARSQAGVSSSSLKFIRVR